MLVVALDETGRHAVQRPGTSEEGGDAIFHCKPPLDDREVELHECSTLPQRQRSACRTAGAWALSAAPRGQAPANVSRIEAALSQRRRHVAADFEAVGA